MGWKRFESEDDVPRFIDAAVDLHRVLFDRLSAADRPFFFDAWLRRFNEADAWLHEDGGDARALVTVPRLADRHEYRWRTRTLVCRGEARGELRLPDEVDLERSFVMPYSGDDEPDGRILAGAGQEPVQLGYVRRLDDGAAPAAPKGCSFRALTGDHVEAVLKLLARAYATPEEPEPDLARVRRELHEIVEHDGGWCFLATRAGGSTPIAVAIYIAMHVPLAGVPAALVGDLAVHPESRRRGIARTLQRHAYVRLRESGLAWAFGNIDPDNPASRRQAEAVGRTVWYRAVRFRPEPG